MTFLKILFFGKMILLTPVPVDLHNQWIELKLDEPLEAITGGASLQVRFSRQHKLFIGAEDSNEVYEIANKALPDGTIEAELVDAHGNKITLSRRVISISKDYVSYGVVRDTSLPTDVEFNKLKIKSRIEIKGVEVFWKNYKH